jgi:hypothetical protein
MVIGLRKLLVGHRGLLIDSIARDLREGDSVHYAKAEPQELQGRLERLVDAFLVATGGSPKSFVDFVRRITMERIAEGYFVHEILTVLNVIEAKACDIVVRDATESRADRYLRHISRTISSTKDQLVQVYFIGKEEAEARAALLEREIKKTAAGARRP